MPQYHTTTPPWAAGERVLAFAGSLATAWVLSAGAAVAQPTDASRVLGSLQQRPASPALAPAPSIQILPSPAPSSMPTGVRQLEVKAFRIEGAQYLAIPKLEALVQPYAGRTLSLSQLQEAADAVTQAYVEAGYSSAHAMVLPQSAPGGVVTITVREGRLERLDVTAAAGMPSAAQRGLQQSMRVGEPVNTLVLAQTLGLINHWPGGGRASADIAPSGEPGASVLSARYASAARVTGYAALDNHGTHDTGRTRASAGLSVNEPAGAGDQLSVQGLTSGERLQYLQATYRVPLGLRSVLGASMGHFRYDACCQGPGQSARGEGRLYGLEASYQAELSNSTGLQWFAGLEQRELLTQGTAPGTPRDRQITALSVGARGYWVSAGHNAWRVAVQAGRADLSASPADLADDTLAERSDGRYSKLVGSYHRSQALGGNWSGYFHTRAQANTGRNLESSEKFVLGGADGIRAYPVGEGVGDSGWLASAELRYGFGAPGLTAAGFVDVGGVKRFSKNEAALIGSVPNRYELGAWGLGLRYEGASAKVLLAVARPIGSNKGVDANGNNTEGQKDGGARAWVSVGWRI
jgi:hemolysin activation/secretion protein